MGIENPVHLLFIAVVVLVVLGPKRLPELARALGRGMREFREAVAEGAATPAEHAQPPSAPTGATPPALGEAPLPSGDAPLLAASQPPGERLEG